VLSQPRFTEQYRISFRRIERETVNDRVSQLVDMFSFIPRRQFTIATSQARPMPA
jgi:hypothetical protein